MNALAPAWTLTATAPTQVQLPVYYSWQFRTGEGGDFESLARRLRINVPAGLGQRTVAIGQPGFAVPGLDPKTTVKVEGALMPLNGSTRPGCLVRSGRAGLRARPRGHRQSARAQPGDRAVCGSAARAAALRPLACGARDGHAWRRELAGLAEPRSPLALGGGARHARSFRSTRKR